MVFVVPVSQKERATEFHQIPNYIMIKLAAVTCMSQIMRLWFPYMEIDQLDCVDTWQVT